MTWTKLFKARKKTYFLFFGLGVILFIINFLVLANWIYIIRWASANPNLIFDHQPEIFKIIYFRLKYILWIIMGVMLIRGVFKKNLAEPLSLISGIIFCYICLIVFLFGTPMVDDYIHRTPFDPIRWKNEESNFKKAVRIRMVDDLLKTHTLIGMTKEQINELLGVPPETSYFREYDYVYWLGPERGLFSIDSEWLVIKFENNKAIEAKIVRD